ncbi:hypothetical protein ElyMa_002487300 [Elysia marginata]|uniref:Ig-like domain-containing protein n=1 Tax=Elysia marginata TaxID=1093978 RepID=A0AAV4GRM5_9GAST|nr:hypothetical protein ElyMa_002487300 [Elysia marginata]
MNLEFNGLEPNETLGSTRDTLFILALLKNLGSNKLQVLSFPTSGSMREAPRHLRKFSFKPDLIEEVPPAVGLSARNKTLVLKIPDHQCDDMVYQCTVTYREHRGMQPDAFATRSAQQVLRNRAAFNLLKVVAYPSKVNNEYTVEDSVTLTCSVIGPRKLELIWSSRSVESGNFSSETKGIRRGYSFYVENYLCNAWRHESKLSLQSRLKHEKGDFLFRCSVKFEEEEEEWTQIKLSLNNSTLSESPVNVFPSDCGGFFCFTK